MLRPAASLAAKEDADACKKPDEIPCPTFRDAAVVRLPLWLYNRLVGWTLAKTAGDDNPGEEEVVEADDDDSEPGKATPPSTDSNEEFEMLEKSSDPAAEARATGSQTTEKSKGAKRKGKKK